MVTTALSRTFPPETVTVNAIPSVVPLRSVVEVSVNAAELPFQTAITTPVLAAPVPLTT